jgi:hypothetical protein
VWLNLLYDEMMNFNLMLRNYILSRRPTKPSFIKSAVFNFDEHQKVGRGKKFFGAVPEDGQIATSVTQIQVSRMSIVNIGISAIFRQDSIPG